MGELAFCLNLLAEPLDSVLRQVAWPSKAADDADAAAPAASADNEDGEAFGMPDVGVAGFAFGITIDQIDMLNRLVQTISAHGDAVAARDMADSADATLPLLGHAIFDGAIEVRALLDQIEAQRLRSRSGTGSMVREARAAYDVGRESAVAHAAVEPVALPPGHAARPVHTPLH